MSDRLAAIFAQRGVEMGLPDTALADMIFRWAQASIRYYEEQQTAEVSDAISTPDAILSAIQARGKAMGDCADFSTILGAIYIRLGWPVKLMWIKSAHPTKGIEDHVWPAVYLDGHWIDADGIVPEPFGWSVPMAERLSQFELPV